MWSADGVSDMQALKL